MHGRNIKNRQAGVDIEVPDHLQGNLRALQAIAYHLRQKHTHLKRNIKLGGLNMDLALDFSIDGGDNWKTILPN